MGASAAHRRRRSGEIRRFSWCPRRARRLGNGDAGTGARRRSDGRGLAVSRAWRRSFGTSSRCPSRSCCPIWCWGPARSRNSCNATAHPMRSGRRWPISSATGRRATGNSPLWLRSTRGWRLPLAARRAPMRRLYLWRRWRRAAAAAEGAFSDRPSACSRAAASRCRAGGDGRSSAPGRRSFLSTGRSSRPCAPPRRAR